MDLEKRLKWDSQAEPSWGLERDSTKKARFAQAPPSERQQRLDGYDPRCERSTPTGSQEIYDHRMQKAQPPRSACGARSFAEGPAAELIADSHDSSKDPRLRKWSPPVSYQPLYLQMQ